AGTAASEICDGKDNDCDGRIDEDVTRGCSTPCGSGNMTCKDGKWADCDAPQPEPETCDGKDNDCDGLVDDAVSLCGSDEVCTSGQCQPFGDNGDGNKAGCVCDSGSADPTTVAPFALAGLLLFRRRRRPSRS